MNAFNFLSNPVADALGWTLLHAVWQGFGLVLPMALSLHFLRNQSSLLRYRLSVFTLFTQLVLSVGTFICYYNPAVEPIYARTTLLQGSAVPIHWQTVTQALPWPQQLQHFLESHLSQFVLIYLIGVVLFGCRLAGGWLYLRQLSQTAHRPTTIVWDHLTDKLRLALNLRMAVQVRESARIATPMVVGVLKPIMLIPLGLAAHLSVHEMEAILAHELAHVKRHDYAVNLLQSVIEVLYFFHPALWWLSARIREEREHCCDDLALQACGGNGRILAQALAHVEELRLTQNQQTPALAMAFTSKQKQLLHRVRRVLGVPTRPFISNSSLAGLTLATILLMSVSVYAVQKQRDHKSKSVHSQSTRRHKVDNTSEYGMTGRNTVSYVVWKGKKLSSRQVARLQSQLTQVMNGQLSLDNVPQPNRDILLAIIEKNSASNVDMAALSEDISRIDYNKIVASSLNDVTLDADDMEGLAKVDYNSIVTEALASVPKTFHALPDSLGKLRLYHQQQMDSLNRLMDQQSRRLHTLHLQMEKMQFPIEELQRQQEVLNWRKEKLITQRNALIEKHQRLLQNDIKPKLNTADVEKQLEALQPEIQKLESSMEELNKQAESLNARQEETNLPMEKLQQESEQIQLQMDKLSEEMDKQAERIGVLMPEIDRNLYGNGALTVTRGFRAPRAPRPARVTTIRGVAALSAPPAAVVPVRGRVGVAAPALPPAPPAKSIKPATAPKPATATVPKVSRLTKPE